MAFAVFKVSAKPVTAGTGITASLKKLRSGPAKLSLAVRSELAFQLGWDDKDMLEVQVGTEEHHGLLRLRKNNSVGTAQVTRRRAMKGSIWFAVSLGHVPNFVDRSETKKHCQFESLEEGGWVEIVLPSWADETGKVHRSAATKAAVVAPSGGTGRRVDLTAGLMGDPPKDRSALNARLGK